MNKVVKALNQKPDGIIISCWPEKAAKIVQELKSRGWKNMGRILLFSSADDAALYSTGGAALNGVIIYNYINVDVETPRWNAFKEAYAKDHNGHQDSRRTNERVAQRPLQRRPSLSLHPAGCLFVVCHHDFCG
jgi:ABC-type branched-subunit amino acid transport system substrate-binding protein